MTSYGRVFGGQIPPHVKVTTKKVFVTSDVQPYKDDIVEGYTYNYVAYTKEEYIRLLSEQNDQLNAELLDTQEALCDLYEMIAGGAL